MYGQLFYTASQPKDCKTTEQKTAVSAQASGLRLPDFDHRGGGAARAHSGGMKRARLTMHEA